MSERAIDARSSGPASSAASPAKLADGDERVAGRDERAEGRSAGDKSHITRRSLAAADTLALLAAMAFAELAVAAGDQAAKDFALTILVLPLWVALFKIYGLYDRDDKRVTHSTVDDLPKLFHALVVGSLGVWAYSKLVCPDPLGLEQGVVFFSTALFLIVAARTAVRTIVIPRYAREQVAFIGTGPLGDILLRKIRRHPEYGLDPVGYLAHANGPALEGSPYLGDPATDLNLVCQRRNVHRVVVLPTNVGMAHADLVRLCTELNLKVSVVPNLVEVLGSAVEMDDLEGVSVLGISPPELSRSSQALKRAMDLILASCAVFIAAPLMVGAAVAIRITSAGPILFSQERIGRGGRRFRILKFRTMVPDAETREAELRAQSRHPAWLLLDDDPRVTRVGKALRRTSIDELPQLLNVLKGDMSLVGPRPMSPIVDKEIQGWGRKRLDLTPGITGLWQALGRTTIPFEEMINLDYLYVTNWSLWADLRLLLRTARVILSRRGAN
jgi:exopolysaccharide biosynthesis polyprenyl glycosylphosphotransferase